MSGSRLRAIGRGFFISENIQTRENLSAIFNCLRIFPSSFYDELMTTYVVQSDPTRYFRPLQLWILEASVIFTRSDSAVVIDDLHAIDSGTPDGFLTQFAASKGEKRESGVKFNAFTSDEFIKMAMMVLRSGETDVKCISNCTEALWEKVGQICQFMFDR